MFYSILDLHFLRCVARGAAVNDAGAQLSADGSLLAVTCYAGTAGSAVASSADRLIYTLDSAASQTETRVTTQNLIFTALPQSGTLWIGSSGPGLMTAPIGSTNQQSPNLINTGSMDNVYDMQVFDGVHYIGQTANQQSFVVGTVPPFPTTGPVSPTSIISPANWRSGKFFVYSDTVIYVANRATSGISKFVKSGDVWSQTATRSLAQVPNGVWAALDNNNIVVVYFTTTRGVYKMTDNGNFGPHSAVFAPFANAYVHDISGVPSGSRKLAIKWFISHP